MTTTVDETKCTGCETCVDECPTQAITVQNEKAKVDQDVCVECGSCVDICPSEAISAD
ncbi:MAG: 4Fe-4S binding protein [Methanoregulaceae archaeon]|nr:4Fe-4S binding protein [Methanoregulaceae archaeon]